MDIKQPLIREVRYEKDIFDSLDLSEKEDKLLLNYPTVYIINDKNEGGYKVYIGETNNIARRTFEHITSDSIKKTEWKELAESDTSNMFVIGHDHFNKSLALDIENKLMLYLSGVDSVKKIHNGRYNEQNDYYTSDEFEGIFSKIWTSLNKQNKYLFPAERVVRDSALFKASPFHKLTKEQLKAKDDIILKITESLSQEKEGQLIIVEGEAGSGKTVLLSSLFYELNQLAEEESNIPTNVVINKLGKKQNLLVNHKQQLKVYEQIVHKLGIEDKQNEKIVLGPTTFINKTAVDDKADIVIIDEAHLLLTQRNQGYHGHGEKQLLDILDRSKVTVIVLDRNQFISREQYWSDDELNKMLLNAKLENRYIELQNQLRMNSDEKTISWIKDLIYSKKINNIPKDSKGYDLQIFNNPTSMYEAIRRKSENQDEGLSRVIATFDWEYSGVRKPANNDMWYVEIDDFKLPWNLQIAKNKKDRSLDGKLSWAEQEITINEVGSTYTIQGFDLNYAGVIIGPSVTYRGGEIKYNPENSKNKMAVQNRRIGDKEVNNAQKYLMNELNVLLTRGVNGLYIYAVDDELREALNKAQKGEL